jgi:probable phosphoglycerate mutase
MSRILIVRHGHVEGIHPERFRGRMDVQLDALGRRQAAATATRIAAGWEVASIYTSPLARAVETGRAIAQATGAPARGLDDLNDLDYGDWQWKTNEEVRAASPVLFDRWFAFPQQVRFPGGESLQDLVARTADAVRFALETHPRQTVVMVGHDAVNRAILIQFLDQPISAYWRLAQSPCAINEIEVENGRARVVRVNDTAHLETIDP